MSPKLFEWPMRYLSPRAWVGKCRSESQYVTGPWPSPGRVAVCRPWFPAPAGATVFEDDDSEYTALRLFRPDVIAAPVVELRRVVHDVLSRAGRPPSPVRGFVALTGIGHRPLTMQDRDLIWLAFRTPVYAEFRDRTGRLLARECEAQCGLHIEGEGAVFSECPDDGKLRVALARGADGALELVDTGMEGRLTSEPCPCGSRAPRLADLWIDDEEIVPAYSATA